MHVSQKIDLSYIFRKSDVSFYSKMPNCLTKIDLPPFLHQPGHKSFSQQTLYARDQRSNSQKLMTVDETLNKKLVVAKRLEDLPTELSKKLRGRKTTCQTSDLRVA